MIFKQYLKSGRNQVRIGADFPYWLGKYPVSLYRTMQFTMFHIRKSLDRNKEMDKEIETWCGFVDAGFLYRDLVLFVAHFLGIGM